MRIAHLILTYTNPAQTERMIKNMSHDNFDFYVHVDKKFDITPHLYLKSLDNVYFIENRMDVKWADFSTVLATFQCIKEIVDTGIKYDFINFLSGQDYPLVRPQMLNEFFIKNLGKEFLSYRDIRNDWVEGLIRMEKFYFTGLNFSGKYMAQDILNTIMPKRKIPYNLHPYGKSMFWMLSPGAAMHVVNTVEGDKKLHHFFSLCWGSDEFVFQTILMNSSYKDKVVNNNYRYIDWSAGGANPKVLGIEDADRLLKTDMLFARKFDMTKKPEILDFIDKYLLADGAYYQYTNVQR